MGQYLPLVVLMALVIAFGGLSRLASSLLAPRRPSARKSMPYECGIDEIHEPPRRFPVSFFVVAMLFIMFDVEIIFLYPYAVAAGELGTFGFWAVMLFSFVFFITFVYEVARGGLEWGPLALQRRVDDTSIRSPQRTLSNSVRRVGSTGRPSPDHQPDDPGHPGADGVAA